jgi:HEAT repeat protein
MGQEAIPAIPYLIAVLGDSREVISLKGVNTVDKLAEQTLVNFGEPARQALLNVLQSENILYGVISALGNMKEIRAVEPLIRLLSNERWDFSAIIALGNIGDPRAVEPLLKLLSQDKKNESDLSHVLIAEALVKLKDPRVVEPLIAYLNTFSRDDLSYESRVVDALGQLKDPHAVESLIAALKKWEGNYSVIKALKEITGQDLKTSDDWARWWEQNKKIK